MKKNDWKDLIDHFFEKRFNYDMRNLFVRLAIGFVIAFFGICLILKIGGVY